MDKAEHAERLRAAMARRNLERRDVADAVGKEVRTITNWTTGAHMPNPADRETLRKLFPGYDEPGDSVVVSIMASDLTEDRRYSLVATYKRLVREQQEGDARSDA